MRYIETMIMQMFSTLLHLIQYFWDTKLLENCACIFQIQSHNKTSLTSTLENSFNSVTLETQYTAVRTNVFTNFLCIIFARDVTSHISQQPPAVDTVEMMPVSCIKHWCAWSDKAGIMMFPRWVLLHDQSSFWKVW